MYRNFNNYTRYPYLAFSHYYNYQSHVCYGELKNLWYYPANCLTTANVVLPTNPYIIFYHLPSTENKDLDTGRLILYYFWY
jgi:hypothetical protein